MNPSLRRCVVLLQGFVFLHSVIDQTQVGDSPPPHDVVGHLQLLSAGVLIVVPLLEHVSVFDG